jgi:hypothetical protein
MFLRCFNDLASGSSVSACCKNKIWSTL